METYFITHINGSDAFQTDKYEDVPKPLIKCVLSLILLFQTMCQSLAKLPVHREVLQESLEGLLTRVLEKCDVHFQSTVWF